MRPRTDPDRETGERHLLRRPGPVFQRRTARRLGVARPLTGAVAFVQRFGSALQLTPHFHVLVPEAVFEELDGAELRLRPLPRPTDAEVETLAVTVARRTLALLRARGVLEEEAVADGVLDVLQLEGIQVPRSGPPPPAPRPGRRTAFVEGFSLHADSWLHENDVVGLERLCNDGARGPLSLERLSALPDGRLAYRMKRASPTGETHLVLPPVAFLRRVAALVPPPRANPRPLLRGLRPQRPGASPRRARASSPCGAHRGSFLPPGAGACPAPTASPPHSLGRAPQADLPDRRPRLPSLRGHPPRRGSRPPFLDGPGHPRALAAPTSPPQLGLG